MSANPTAIFQTIDELLQKATEDLKAAREVHVPNYTGRHLATRIQNALNTVSQIKDLCSSQMSAPPSSEPIETQKQEDNHLDKGKADGSEQWK